MQVTIDTTKWKFDPRIWAAFLAFLGFANLGDLVGWVKGVVFNRRPAYVAEAIAAEERARRTADSAILVRLDTMAEKVDGVSAGMDSLWREQRRVVSGLRLTQDYLLQVPQVKAYKKERLKADSLRRERDRLRSEAFDRDARGPWHPDRDIR